MRADRRWAEQPDAFWDYVRVLSENLGYKKRGAGVYVHDTDRIKMGLERLNLEAPDPTKPATHGVDIDDLAAYFQFRADLIDKQIASHLMDVDDARKLFFDIAEKYTTGYSSTFRRGTEIEQRRVYDVRNGVPVTVPFNKQKGTKYDLDFFTGAINILVSHYLQGQSFDFDPRQLPVGTSDGVVTSSMSRRLDGAYPSCINPVALWEIKAYYYTTTFGSKISDAVYIADLDGYERDRVERATGNRVHMVTMIDSYSTWYVQGPAYLCRLVDMLHRGAIDDLIVGKEIVSEIPSLIADWTQRQQQRITPP